MADIIVELDQQDHLEFDLNQEDQRDIDLEQIKAVVIGGIKYEEDPVDSGFVKYNAETDKYTTITPESTVTKDSDNIVTSKAIYDYVETHVDAKIADLVNSAPEMLDTLGEVAKAIQENETVIDALNGAIENKQDKLTSGENINIDENGVISAVMPEQTLPVASKETLGVVRVWIENDYLCFSTEEPMKYSRIFSENTPEQISMASAEISANNYTSAQVAEIYGWNLGDTIPITLTTGEEIEMRIIGFNHDDKSDGTGKAGITLDMVNCLKDKYKLNNTYYTTGGFPQCTFNTTTRPLIKATIPEEWQNVIKNVDKKSANGAYTNFSAVVTTSQDLFLLSEIELFGKVLRAQGGANEGVVYEYWNGKTAEDRIKVVEGDTSTSHYWALRSASNQNAYYYCYCTRLGVIVTEPQYAKGISFAFCV